MKPERTVLPGPANPPSAMIRIGVPTYRRPELLRRALTSLQAQTFSDWIATVHNDAPDDEAPATIASELGDPRIQVMPMPRHLGPVAVFNLAYTSGTEPFFALLEDDNTWQPEFLQRLLNVLENHPSVAAVWCNQRVIQLTDSGMWIDAGHSVRPEAVAENEPPRWATWGDFRHATGAALSNGAMLIRRSLAPALITPAIPFAGVEAVRERLLPHPLLYVPQSLATLGLTRTTARSGDRHAWGALQTLLLATFVRHAGLDAPGRNSFWQYLRGQTPAATNIALHAALSCPGCRSLLAGAGPRDWFRYLRTLLGRPAGAWACLRARGRHPDWWALLESATAARFAESSPPGGIRPQ